MNMSLNELGKAFWNGGLFGTVVALLNQKPELPKPGEPVPDWKDYPLLTINDRGFSRFNVKDPKWLEKIRVAQAVTMARPYPTLADLECDLLGMHLVSDDEIEELKEINAFIIKSYGKKSPREIRVRLALSPQEEPGPTVPLELTEEDVGLLRIFTAYLLGHEEGGGISPRLLDISLDWGPEDDRLRSLCRFAAEIPLQAGTMHLGAGNFYGAKAVSIAVMDFLRIAVDGPLSDGNHGMQNLVGASPFVHFALFAFRDLSEILSVTLLARKIADAVGQLEKAGRGNGNREPIFVFSRNSFDYLLHDWYDRIAKARPMLSPRPGFDLPNLWDLGGAIIDTSGMTVKDSEEWGNVANAIREYVGAENLSEVFVKFDETI